MQYALGYQLGKDLVDVESRPQDLQKRHRGRPQGRQAEADGRGDGGRARGARAAVTAQRQKAQAAASEKALADGQAYLGAECEKAGL